MKLKDPGWFSNGGPLFPIKRGPDPRDGSIEISTSATMADFFAAHAPQPPEWFELEPSAKPPQPLDRARVLARDPKYKALPNNEKSELLAWFRDGAWGLPDHMQLIADAANLQLRQREEEIRRYTDQLTHDRYFAWRWYYAHRMLLQRPD